MRGRRRNTKWDDTIRASSLLINNSRQQESMCRKFDRESGACFACESPQLRPIVFSCLSSNTLGSSLSLQLASWRDQVLKRKKKESKKERQRRGRKKRRQHAGSLVLSGHLNLHRHRFTFTSAWAARSWVFLSLHCIQSDRTLLDLLNKLPSKSKETEKADTRSREREQVPGWHFMKS